MEGIPLKIDLSAFFNNIFEKVMILADRQWGNVAKVEKRVRKMFKIEGNIGFKNEEGYYIPSEEPIEILKHVKILIAFKKLQTTEESNQNESHETTKIAESININQPITAANLVAKKKRNRHALNESNFKTSTPNLATTNLAKRRRGLDVMTPNTSEDTQISNINGVLPLKNITNDDTEKATQSKTNTCAADSEETVINRNKNENMSTPSSLRNTASKYNSRAHIYYDDFGDKKNANANSQPEKQKMEIEFICDLENSNQKRGRVFRIDDNDNNMELNENIAKNKLSNAIEIIENITLASSKPLDNVSSKDDDNKSAKSGEATDCPQNPTIDTSEGQSKELSQSKMCATSLLSGDISYDDSAVIELNDSEYATDSANNTLDATNLSSQNVSAKNNEYCAEKVLSNANDLIGLPHVDDLIVFKIKLTSGKISDFFVGKCEYVNKRTKTLKLQLKDGFSQIAFIPPKFACNVDDSANLHSLNIKIQDMLDPKVSRS